MPQLLHSAMQIDADRSVREAGARGDFWSGHSFDEAKDERLAVRIRQTANRFEDGVGFGAVRCTAAAACGLILWFVVELVSRRARLAEKIDGAIARDCRDPSSKMIRLAQRMDVRHGTDENVLHKILDCLDRHAAQQNAVNHARVPLVQMSERSAVAVLRSADELFVRTIAQSAGIHGTAIRERELQFERRCHGAAISLLKQLPWYRREKRPGVNDTPKLPVCSNLPDASGSIRVQR